MHGDDYHHGTTGLGGVVGGSDERGAAERAGGVRAQPLAGAGGVEVVHARRQHPDGHSVLEVCQAHPAYEPSRHPSAFLYVHTSGGSAPRTGGTSTAATVEGSLSAKPPARLLV